MQENKKTKIVSTLGPATDARETLEKMMKSGVNMFRINFSHANYEDVEKKIKTIRELNKENKMNVGVLADLQGPKLRIGVMKEEVVVKKGDRLHFLTGEKFEGTSEKLYLNYETFAKDVKPGEQILLDDGKLIFEVLATDGENSVEVEVLQGGPVKSRKGVNLPNTAISLPALTEKDRKDAAFAIEQEVDWIALSFVRKAEDCKVLNQIIAEKSEHRIPVISKIEKPSAVNNIDSIITESDGLMVARGDLGVEVPAHEVPLIQKELVRKAKSNRIPVIIATQMMETMIQSLTPTRAEVNDVANSVMDGADAVMLSAETSVGKFPVQVIDKMTQILATVEDSEIIEVPQDPPHIKTKRYITKSVCYHAVLVSNEIDAQAICTLTNSGYTAFQISAWRPSAHILAFTSNVRILRKMSLLWGVSAFFYDEFESTDKTVDDVNKIAASEGFAKEGEYCVNLAAMPIADKGMVNTLRITEID